MGAKTPPLRNANVISGAHSTAVSQMRSLFSVKRVVGKSGIVM